MINKMTKKLDNGQYIDHCVMTQTEVAEKMFLNYKTVASTEKRAIEKFKQAFLERGIKLEDLL